MRRAGPSAQAPLGAGREERRIGRTLRAVSLTLLLAGVVVGGAILLLVRDGAGARMACLVLVVAGAGGALGLARRGRARAGGGLLVATLGSGIGAGLFADGSLYGPTIVGVPILVMVTGLLLGTRSAVVATLLSITALGIVGARRSDEALEAALASHSVASLWWIESTALLAACVLICVAIRRTREALDDADAGEAALAQRNRELELEARRRRRAEAALGESELRYRTLVEHSDDAIAEIDLAGRVRFASPSFARTFGGLCGRSLKQWAHPEDVGRAARFLQDLTARGVVRGEPIRGRTPDGRWRWIESSGATFVDRQGEIRAVTVSRDVTERRQLEQRLRESQKLEAIARLAGGVAHDFNNLLTVISGNAELLRLRTQDAGDREALDQMLDAAERGAALVRQLLAFGRGQPLEPRLLDVNDVVESVYRLLRRLIGENVELLTRLDPGPLAVEADPSQIEQILLNLALNARDAISERGRIVLETRGCTEESSSGGSAAKPEAWVMIAVSDDGVGMDDETRARILEPYFTTKDPGRGTGLGLPTVHGIVEQSGGSLEIESRPGAGTCVRVFLPRAEAREAASPPPRSPSAQPAEPSTATILLVEDEESVRRLVRDILEKHGYRVLAAEHGAVARDLAHHGGPIDLLLTDVVMPVMGGYELYERLAAERPGLPALFMSGYCAQPSPPRAEAIPALQKPFTPDQLLAAVRSALQLGSRASP